MCLEPQNAKTATKKTKQKVVWKRFSVPWPRSVVALGAAEGDAARSPLLQPAGISCPAVHRRRAAGHPAGAWAAPPRVKAPLRWDGRGRCWAGRTDPSAGSWFPPRVQGEYPNLPCAKPVQRVYLGSKCRLA